MLTQILIICPIVFLAGFIDSIAGGGGLISLPAYSIILKSPMTLVFGTNKFSSVWGTLISSIKFIKSKNIHVESAATAAIFSLIGSKLGSVTALSVSNEFLKISLLIAVPAVAIFTLLKKDFGDQKTFYMPLIKIIFTTIIFSFFIGFYDGFFGPGAGTFFVLAFTTLTGFDMTKATGNAKIANLASNVSACQTYIFSGNVAYQLAVPAAFCSILGNYIGSNLAIKNGKKIIKPVFIIVLSLLLITVALQLAGFSF
ncbi:MAG: TSUP family transporter [Clostridiales bacterium]|nr:TSUP family transporter [Clostridiales bacterium]